MCCAAISRVWFCQHLNYAAQIKPRQLLVTIITHARPPKSRAWRCCLSDFPDTSLVCELSLDQERKRSCDCEEFVPRTISTLFFRQHKREREEHTKSKLAERSGYSSCYHQREEKLSQTLCCVLIYHCKLFRWVFRSEESVESMAKLTPWAI